jgi:ABC-type branched-subunit amino acid transport system substrate-binding protein
VLKMRKNPGRRLPTPWWIAAVLSLPILAGNPFHAGTTPSGCGKAIYLTGLDCSGAEIKSRLGDVELSGKAQACVNCHGATGKGASEGGVVAGDITWDHLNLPYGHTDPDGRKHPAYTNESFYRTLTQGLDPANHQLPVTMPRFQLSRQQATDIADYLKTISSDYDPGLDENTIHIACLLPAGTRDDASNAIRQTLTDYFDDLNQAGGVYNRRVALHFVDGGDAGQGVAQIRKLILNGEAFAILMPWGIAGKEADELAESSLTPMLAFSDEFAGDGRPQKYVFSLVTGASLEAEQLIKFAVREKSVSSEHAAVIFSADESRSLPDFVEQAWRDLALPPAGTYSVASLSEPLLSFAQRLQKQGTESVFFFGPTTDAMSFLQAAHQADWAPTMFFAGSVTRADIAEAPPEFDRKIFFCSSASAEGPGSAAATQFRDFSHRHHLPDQFWWWQAAAFSSSRVLEH